MLIQAPQKGMQAMHDPTSKQESSGEHGIQVHSDNCIISDNVSSNNGLCGIYVLGRFNLVERNQVSNNGQSGIYFGTLAFDNAFGRNLGRGNGVPPTGSCVATPGCLLPEVCEENAGSNTSFADNFLPGNC